MSAWIACERYRSQTVTVTRIVVSGSALATHWGRFCSEGWLPSPFDSQTGQRVPMRLDIFFNEVF